MRPNERMINERRRKRRHGGGEGGREGGRTYLREQLLEVIRHIPGLLRQDGKRGIVPHRAQSLLPSHGHGVEKQVQRLGRVAKHVEVTVAGERGEGGREGGREGE